MSKSAVDSQANDTLYSEVIPNFSSSSSTDCTSWAASTSVVASVVASTSVVASSACSSPPASWSSSASTEDVSLPPGTSKRWWMWQDNE